MTRSISAGVRLQSVGDARRMVGVPRFHGDLDLDGAKWKTDSLSAVLHLKHVAAGACHGLQDQSKVPRLIGDQHRELGESSGRFETVTHHFPQEHEVDVPAGQHDADRIGGMVGEQLLQKRGDTYCPRCLDHHLRTVEDVGKGRCRLRVIDNEDVVDMLLGDVPDDLRGDRDGNAVGHRWHTARESSIIDPRVRLAA